MHINISDTSKELGEKAGEKAASLIKDRINENGEAHIILATGTSQLETIKQLISDPEIDWSKVVMFHLDEYIGLPESHPASFRKYLKERFINKIQPLKEYFLINGEADSNAECNRLNNTIREYPIDVAFVGIGENGHLAFNDPPADFEVEDPYIIVDLDDKCRNQQLNEGWFNIFEEVPQQAISMTIKQVCKSKHIICSVPDARKAEAVKCSLEGPISNLCPASILQEHPECSFFLEKSSAKLLSKTG